MSQKGPSLLKAPVPPEFSELPTVLFRSSCAPFAFILLLLSFFFTYSYIRPSTYNWNIKSSCHSLLPLALCRLLYAGRLLPAQLPHCPACLTHCRRRRLCAAAFFLFPSKGFFCLLRTLLLCYTTEEPEEGNPSTTICILYRRTLQGDKVGIIKSVGCFIMISCMFLPCYTDHCV